ncbi:3'-5' exonuclease [Streptomyces alboflavus]|uniref:3'-5' exonuclease n=1 Tax=Streptomyces alboflavus TaxID=67267 RepID=UPI0004C11AD5|nr:3'-5' exonuclease [Streptomyces alboflavus]
MSWPTNRMAGFDLESTGVDVESARIVTACVVACGGGAPTESATWLADPGVEIPAEAAAIHGITTEKARAEGRPAAEVVAEVTDALVEAAEAGVPIVVMNAAFDFTLLDRERERHGVKSLWARAVPLVLDPRVLDKHIDPYRRGGRKLVDLCRHYEVPLDGAHSADADAIAACRVVWRLGSTLPDLGRLPLAELHELQVAWAKRQAESLASYFRRTPGKEHQADGVRVEWPLVPAPRQGGGR